MNVRPANCERAAQLVSLDLDDHLSYLERASLARHLRRCAACREQATRTTEATRMLRAAPLEPIRVELPTRARPRRLARRPAALAAVSVAALCAWLGVAPGRGHAPPRSGGIAATAVRASPNDRFDWPAGVPRSPQVVQFVPGGRFTFGL